MLARYWLNVVHSRTCQIAVTGSYGKTTVTRAIFAVLARSNSIIVTDINLDTRYNVPMTALHLRGHKYALFELGIDMPGEMDGHLSIVHPHITVLTGIAPVHADAAHLGSVTNIIREKRRAIEVLRSDDVAILNRDDLYLRDIFRYTPARVVWYGHGPECHVRIDEVSVSSSNTTITLGLADDKRTLVTQLLGSHSASNIAAAVAVSQVLGVSWSDIETGLGSLSPSAGRLSLESGPKGLIIINDTLRANPVSTAAGLRFLRDISVEGHRIAVLAEMGELGSYASSEHASVGRLAAECNLDYLICFGGLTEITAKNAIGAGLDPRRVHFTSSLRDVVSSLEAICRPGDVLYLKGSLLKHIDRVLLMLEGIDVGCHVLSCPFHNPCLACRFLESGPPDYIRTTER